MIVGIVIRKLAWKRGSMEAWKRGAGRMAVRNLIGGILWSIKDKKFADN